MRKLQITIFILALTISIFSLLSTKFVYKVAAQDSSQNIIITEIAAHEPSNLEWIEIYNTTDQDINITNLILYENDTNHSIISNGILPAKTYALIANKAEEIDHENSELIFDSSWSSLNQSGENLQLILNDTIQDSVTYPSFTQNTSLERVHLNEAYTDQWLHNPESDSALEINHNQIQEQEICTQETVTITETVYKESPIFLFSEINFKNTTQDWIEIYIDPKNQELNLQEYSLKIDNSASPISSETISEPQLIVLEANLVGTTEQVLLIKEDKILDVFCWANSTPPQSEIEETQELQNADIWKEECFNSEELKTNQSISRSNFFTDTNSLSDWSTNLRETKSELNTFQNLAPIPKINIQSGKTINEEKISINLDGSQSEDPENDELTYFWDFDNNQTSDKANPSTITYAEEGTYQITLTVTDQYNFSSTAILYIEVLPKTEPQTMSSKTSDDKTLVASSSAQETKITNFIDGKISLHSFFPNPEGSDQTKEWIKLINNDTKNINLENWILDDSDNSGSKPYTINNINLAPGETHTFTDTDTNLVLNNTSDSIRLLKPNQELKEQTNYTDSKDNEIFIKINNEWQRNIQTNNQLITSSLISNIQSPTSTTKNSSKSSSINGTKNKQLQITEIFPNPKGTDTGKEWIEIYNPSTETASLGNWKIKYNSKEQVLNNEEIPPQSYKQIQITSSALPNNETNLALLDFEDNIISQASYQKSEEGESYSNISNNWLWTDIITPNQPNPEIIELEGIITNINSENQTLTLSSSSGTESQILFNSKNLDSQIDLESQYKVKLKVFNHNSKLLLTEFLTIEKIPEPSKKTGELPLIIILSSLAILSIIFKKQIINFLKEHQIWHNEENLNQVDVQQKAS